MQRSSSVMLFGLGSLYENTDSSILCGFSITGKSVGKEELRQ